MRTVATNIIGGAVVAALALGGAASAAGYLKLGDIKGEATAADGHKEWIDVESFSMPVHKPGGAASSAPQQGTLTIGDQDPVAIGLLLPAVQKVRDAAARSQTRTAPKATYRETDANGRVIRTYWLSDVTLKRGVSGAIDISYRCKTWRDERTKKTGGDCPGDAEAVQTKSKGKVEATWKVEEGVK